MVNLNPSLEANPKPWALNVCTWQARRLLQATPAAETPSASQGPAAEGTSKKESPTGSPGTGELGTGRSGQLLTQRVPPTDFYVHESLTLLFPHSIPTFLSTNRDRSSEVRNPAKH